MEGHAPAWEGYAGGVELSFPSRSVGVMCTEERHDVPVVSMASVNNDAIDLATMHPSALRDQGMESDLAPTLMDYATVTHVDSKVYCNGVSATVHMPEQPPNAQSFPLRMTPKVELSLPPLPDTQFDGAVNGMNLFPPDENGIADTDPLAPNGMAHDAPQRTSWGIALARCNAHSFATEGGRRWFEQRQSQLNRRDNFVDREEHRHMINRKSAKVSRLRRREYVKQLEVEVLRGESYTRRLQGEVSAVDDETKRLRTQQQFLESILSGQRVQIPQS